MRAVHRSWENSASARAAPSLPERRRARAVRREARIASASCSTSDGGDEQAGAAVLHDLGKPADGARDHGPPALHRLERDHPEALAERRHDDDLRALEDLTDALDVTEERDDVVEAEPAHRRAEVGLERAVAGDLERDAGEVAPSGGERVEEHVVPLDRDQAPTTASRGAPGSGSGGGPGSIP